MSEASLSTLGVKLLAPFRQTNSAWIVLDLSISTAHPRFVHRKRLQSRARLVLTAMKSLRGKVKNGRLILDVPTDLPEGTEVELEPVEERPPESHYEPVSVRELELVEKELSEITQMMAGAPAPPPARPTGPPAIEESSYFISPRAPARSVIARRHLATVSQKHLASVTGTELATQVRDAAARATKHLRQLEAEPDGENYLTNAKEALACAREALSLLQSATESRPELVPAAEEVAEAVGMIFSLLS
jgi:hypothetical protein